MPALARGGRRGPAAARPGGDAAPWPSLSPASGPAFRKAYPPTGSSRTGREPSVSPGAERACERLGTLPAGSGELSREAHSLKGTAGTFGLSRISAVAEAIEAAAQEGREVSGLVGRLGATVAATREALREAGLVPD